MYYPAESELGTPNSQERFGILFSRGSKKTNRFKIDGLKQFLPSFICMPFTHMRLHGKGLIVSHCDKRFFESFFFFTTRQMSLTKPKWLHHEINVVQC